MKRIVSASFVLLLIVCFGMTGCGKPVAVIEDGQYGLPQIQDDTADAAYINDKIIALYADKVTLMEQGEEGEDDKPYYEVTYEAYTNGDVLSLVVKCASNLVFLEEYNVYNYHTSKGIQLTNKDVMTMEGIDGDQLLSAIRRAAAADYDEKHFIDYDMEIDPMFLSELNERRAAMLAPDNITTDIPLYIGGEGQLQAVVPITSLSETDRIYTPLPLDVDTSDTHLTASYLDFIKAELTDGELSITITQTDNLGPPIIYDMVKSPAYDTAIPVHGCYSRYKEMFFLRGLGSSWPTLLLLTTEGRLEYVDVEAGITAEYFCVGGPLPNIVDVVSVQEEDDENGEAVTYAVRSDGSRVALPDLMAMEFSSMSNRLFGDWSTTITYETDGGGSYDEYFLLSLPDGQSVTLEGDVFNVGLHSLRTGNLRYMGMCDTGAVYYYSLWNEDSRTLSMGAASLNVVFEEYGDIGSVYMLQLTELGGDALFFTEPGRTVVFLATFG